MILYLIEFLKSYFGLSVPGVFGYYSTRMMLGAITALAICIYLGPWFIRKLYAFKIGQSIRNEECAPLLYELHRNKRDTPTMGGLLILASMLISMALWMDIKNVFTLILFLTTVILGGLGACDDYLKMKYKNAKGVAGKKKLLIQSLVALGIALYLLYPNTFSSNLDITVQENSVKGWFASPAIKDVSRSMPVPVQEFASRVYFPFFKEPILTFSGVWVFLAVLLTLFVIVGASNAVNLTDGLDGLASGCLVMVASCLALIAFLSNHIEIANYLNILYIEGSGEIAIYLSSMAGACLGFLWYNGYPAQVFMGDTGSLALGGVLGVAAVLLKREFLLGIIGGIFVAEALSVILQVSSFRLRKGKRIFRIAPLHHHFEYKGWPETKVVMRFWIIGLLLAIIGIASLKFQ